MRRAQRLKEKVGSYFEVAAGSVAGKRHYEKRENNQSYYHVERGFLSFVAVVADGCGSHPHSEVGAKLGSRIVAQAFLSVSAENSGSSVGGGRLFKEVEKRAVLNIEEACVKIAGLNDYTRFVKDYFLFSISGILVTRAMTYTFTYGDGIVAINDDVRIVDPATGNSPAYIGYQITGSDEPAHLGAGFNVHHVVETDEVESFLVGDDGVAWFIRSEGDNLPGREGQVGPLSQFWKKDEYYNNPFSVERRLKLAAQTVTRPDWGNLQMRKSPGLLPDDVCLVAGRKRE